MLIAFLFTLFSFAESKQLSLQLEKSFKTSQFKIGLNRLEKNYQNKNRDLFYYKYKSIFYSYLLAQKWNQKEDTFSLLSLINKIKEHNKKMIELFPDNGIGYTGLGEYYTYIPWYLGGGAEKAEIMLKKGATLDRSIYSTYKLLMLYMNKTFEYKKADLVLSKLENLEYKNLAYYENHIPNWVSYQRGVYFYSSGDMDSAEKKLKYHCSLVQDSYWGLYFLWKIGKERGKENSLTIEKALFWAEKYSDRTFIERIKKENGNN